MWHQLTGLLPRMESQLTTAKSSMAEAGIVPTRKYYVQWGLRGMWFSGLQYRVDVVVDDCPHRCKHAHTHVRTHTHTHTIYA